jgi:hypothetical protein
MIITENITINGKVFVKTCSDSGYMIERDGIRYSEAIDPVEFGRIYTETDEHIPYDEMPEVEQKAAAYDILTGVSE